MIRCRFQQPTDDYRPVSWPIQHPYWCSGQGDDYWIIIAYADDEDEILRLWPEAVQLESEQCDNGEYFYSSRFPKPDWFEPEPIQATGEDPNGLR